MRSPGLYRVLSLWLAASAFSLPSFADDLGFRGTSEGAADLLIVPASVTVVEKSAEAPAFLMKRKVATEKPVAKTVKTVRAKPVLAAIKREPRQIPIASTSMTVSKSEFAALRAALQPAERAISVEAVYPLVIQTDQADDIYTASLPAVEPTPDLYTSSLPAAQEPEHDLYVVKPDDQSLTVASISDAAKSARENSPLIKAFEAEAKAADAGVARERAAYAPTVTGTVASTYEKLSDGVGANNYGDLAFQVPLYTGGQRSNRLRSAEAQSEAARSNILAAEDRVTSEVAQAYAQYVSAHEMVQLLKETESGLRRVQGTIEEQRKAGLASGPDVQNVRIEIRSNGQQIADAETALGKAREKITQMAGRPVSPQIDTAALERGLHAGRDALKLKVMAENPRVISAIKGYESARSTYESKSGRALPQLNLAGNYRYDLDNNVNRIGRETWNVGARLTVPLLDLSTRADTEQARYQAEAAYYRAQEQRRQVADEFTQTWSEYVGGLKEKQAAEAKIAERRKLVASARARFEEGDGSLVDYLNVQSEVRRAELELLQIRSKHIANVTQLLVLSGQFDETVLAQ